MRYKTLPVYVPTETLANAPFSRVVAACQLATWSSSDVVRKVLSCAPDQPSSPARRRVIEWAVRAGYLKQAGHEAEKRREAVRKVREERREERNELPKTLEALAEFVDGLERAAAEGPELTGHEAVMAAVRLADAKEEIAALAKSEASK